MEACTLLGDWLADSRSDKRVCEQDYLRPVSVWGAVSIEFGWTAATAVAGWLQHAVKAARNQRQQRYAHIIGNSGVLVAGLRDIDREVHRLFLPLMYFNPQGWPEDKRQQWAERIIALANEDIILPRMRTADSALAMLAMQEADPEIVGLIERLRVVDPERPHQPMEEQDSIGSLLAEAAILGQVYFVDMLIGDYIPEIVDALLGNDPADLDGISGIARVMVSQKESGLRAMANATETNFGLLLAHQQRVFPTLPAPTWVWAGPPGTAVQDHEGS